MFSTTNPQNFSDDVQSLLTLENPSSEVSLPNRFKKITGTYSHLLQKFKSNPIAVASTCELSYALSFAAVAFSISEKSTYTWYNNSFTFSSIIAINFFLRKAVPYNSDHNKWVRRLVQLSRSAIWSGLDEILRDGLFHELAHEFALLIFYHNPHPSVSMKWNTLEMTTHYDKTLVLNSLGKTIGEANSNILMNSAGGLMTMIWSIASLIAAQLISDNYAEIKYHLRLATITNITFLIGYAISPEIFDCNKNNSNDFCQLQKYNINPAETIPIILGSILLVQLLLSGGTRFRRTQKSKNTYQALEQEMDVIVDHTNITDDEEVALELKTPEEQNDSRRSSMKNSI